METKEEELQARREARRRKILENSKNRLSKISGRENEDTENGMFCKIMFFSLSLSKQNVVLQTNQQQHRNHHCHQVRP